MLLFNYDRQQSNRQGGEKMDNEDFGVNNRPFQRYVPSCYGRYQKYIPSIYRVEKNEISAGDGALFDDLPVVDDLTYDFINNVAQL